MQQDNNSKNLLVLGALIIVSGISLSSIGSLFSEANDLIEKTYSSVLNPSAIDSARIASHTIDHLPDPSDSNSISLPEADTDTSKDTTTKTDTTTDGTPTKIYTKPKTTTTTTKPSTTQPKAYKLPEKTEIQKLDEEKGLNPYSKVAETEPIEPSTLTTWRVNREFKKDLNGAIDDTTKDAVGDTEEEKKEFIVFDSDNEEKFVNKETNIRIAITSEEELEALMEFEENTLVIGPYSDSDQDGIGDLVESYYGTNAFLADTDSDGIDDMDEIDLGGDPLEATEIDYTPGVINLTNNLIGNETFIKGVAPPGEAVTIEAQNIETGETFIVFQGTADENGKFAGIANFASGDPTGGVSSGDPSGGRSSYYVYSNHQGDDGRRIARVTVDHLAELDTPEAEVTRKVKTKLAARITNARNWMTTFLGRSLYYGLFANSVEIVPEDGYIERLVGEAEAGNIVTITWQSLILSSVVIADASQGRYEALIPRKLSPGSHEATIYAYNPQTNFLSNIARIIFFKS